MERNKRENIRENTETHAALRVVVKISTAVTGSLVTM